jgi:DNA-binding CsgD family transcriptional regulator
MLKTDESFGECPTQNEIEILRLRWDGLTNREIADLRFVSPKTIEMHLYNLRIKLGARNLTDMYRWGLRETLLSINPPRPGHAGRRDDK